MTDSMIRLSATVVNPDHVEEAYLQECSSSSSSGHYIQIQGINYSCPTKTGVVVHYASGRTRVYGGDDANALWVGLYYVPAYVDNEDYKVLEAHGLKVKIRGENDSQSYDWVHIPAQLDHNELAEKLLQLLWVHNYIETDVIAGIDEGTHEAVFMQEGVGVMPSNGFFRDAVLAMPCSYMSN